MIDLSQILANPHFMPVGVTSDLRGIRFAKIRSDTVRAQSFLDGRTPFTEGAEIILPVDGVTAELAGQPNIPTPFILHVSFCGSTLLSSLLDIPRRSLGLREPAIQIELADAMMSHPEKVRRIAGLVETLLGRSVDGQQTVVKPTNWANNLLPVWHDLHAINPVFLVMGPRPFLRAVFRGGRNRLTYTMRTAQHLASSLKDGPDMLARATGLVADPLLHAACLTLLALSFQQLMFKEALNKGGLSTERIISFNTLSFDPTGTAMRAAQLLDLQITPAMIARHSNAILARNSKSPQQPFRADDEVENNRIIEHHHSHIFDTALDWADREGLYMSMADSS